MKDGDLCCFIKLKSMCDTILVVFINFTEKKYDLWPTCNKYYQ